MSLATAMRGLAMSLQKLTIPAQETAIAGGVLSFNQQRNHPTQKHQKILAAAQKRNRLRKQQKSTEIKLGYVERKKAELKKTLLKSKRYNVDGWLERAPEDDVYFKMFFRRGVYSPEMCLAMHRETNHPSIIGQPDALVVAQVELDMKGKKKNKFIDKFDGTVLYPNTFDHKGRIEKILLFCKSADEAALAMENGADLAGGSQLIKRIQSGEVDATVFDHVLCSVEMVDEVTTLRQILKKKLPIAGKTNTISTEPLELVKKFRKAVSYEAHGDAHEPDFGSFTVPIGRLSMSNEQLMENLKTLFDEIYTHKPKGRPANSFVTEVYLCSPPSNERFVMDRSQFLESVEDKKSKKKQKDEDEDDD